MVIKTIWQSVSKRRETLMTTRLLLEVVDDRAEKCVYTYRVEFLVMEISDFLMQ